MEMITMYELKLKAVMKAKVTLQDWENFRLFMETLPATNDLEEIARRRKDFAEAAKFVVKRLSYHDIVSDTALFLAYMELENP